jgi:hypothetical protein
MDGRVWYYRPLAGKKENASVPYILRLFNHKTFSAMKVHMFLVSHVRNSVGSYVLQCREREGPELGSERTL